MPNSNNASSLLHVSSLPCPSLFSYVHDIDLSGNFVRMSAWAGWRMRSSMLSRPLKNKKRGNFIIHIMTSTPPITHLTKIDLALCICQLVVKQLNSQNLGISLFSISKGLGVAVGKRTRFWMKRPMSGNGELELWRLQPSWLLEDTRPFPVVWPLCTCWLWALVGKELSLFLTLSQYKPWSSGSLNRHLLAQSLMTEGVISWGPHYLCG